MTLRTVTLSPGFDHVVTIDRLAPGDVGRVLSWQVFASGKGVNVARTAAALGVAGVAYSLVGEADSDEFDSMVETYGVRPVTVRVPGGTRRNLTLGLELPGYVAAHAVAPRLRAEASHAEELIARLVADVQPGDIVTLNGAVADGVPTSIWAEAGSAVHRRGAIVLADVQDQPLRELLSAGVVSMAKPNQAEAQALLENAVGGDMLRVAAEALNIMKQRGVEVPVVTLGDSGVAHLKDGQQVHTFCPVDVARLVVGAGDAFMAGYCVALEGGAWREHDPVALGVAVAAAHVSGAADRTLPPATRSALGRVVHILPARGGDQLSELPGPRPEAPPTTRERYQ